MRCAQHSLRGYSLWKHSGPKFSETVSSKEIIKCLKTELQIAHVRAEEAVSWVSAGMKTVTEDDWHMIACPCSSI